MRFARLLIKGRPVPALEMNGYHHSLNGYIDDIDLSMLSKLMADKAIHIGELPAIDMGEARFLPPISRPGKIICIGLNYQDHAKEGNMAAPERPVFFLKASSAMAGAFDDIVLSGISKKVDWEAELAIVIGKYAKNVTVDRALEHVFGYTIMNDVTDRYYQLELGGQWVQGKSFDGFAPLGPYIVPACGVHNPHDLKIELWLNGVVQQAARTSQMIFKIPNIISYISQLMSLHPGDIISTGTPAGVGYGQKPPRFLRAGDRIDITIDQLGSQQQNVVLEY